MLSLTAVSDRRGNKFLLGINIMNIGIYLLTKAYYTWRNRKREEKWNALTKEVRQHPTLTPDPLLTRVKEQLKYLDTTTDSGSKRLDFRFAH